MLPLLGIVAQLFPEIIKPLGAPLHEQSGSVQDQVLDAIKKATGLLSPETLDPKIVEAEMQKPAANTQLSKDLQQITLDELKSGTARMRRRSGSNSSGIAWRPKRVTATGRRNFGDKCSTSRIGRSRVPRK
jgi:hypothetical protein